MRMTNKTAAEFMENELRCVQRADSHCCDRNCSKCDLLRSSDDLVAAYGLAIIALEKMNILEQLIDKPIKGELARIAFIRKVKGVVSGETISASERCFRADKKI